MQQATRSKAEAVIHLRELVKGIQFAMLTTLSRDDESLRSRPLTLQQASFDGDFWFFVGKSSPLVQDILGNMRVNLAFADPASSAYVSVSGIAFLVEDRAKAEELWNPFLKSWFPKGLADPDLALLRVHIESADYWASPSAKVVRLLGFAKAIKRGHVELGDQAS